MTIIPVYFAIISSFDFPLKIYNKFAVCKTLEHTSTCKNRPEFKGVKLILNPFNTSNPFYAS